MVLLAAVLLSALLIRFKLPAAFLGFGVVSALVAFSLAYRPNVVLVNRFTRYAGKVSYSGYLMHFWVVDVLRERLPQAGFFHSLPALAQYFLFVVAATAGTLIVATITYQFVEKPGRNIGRRIIQRVKSTKVASDALRR